MSVHLFNLVFLYKLGVNTKYAKVCIVHICICTWQANKFFFELYALARVYKLHGDGITCVHSYSIFIHQINLFCWCRWEKYQNEEEATLGRGKRLRKAISYREAYALHPAETPNEVIKKYHLGMVNIVPLHPYSLCILMSYVHAFKKFCVWTY